ncbi:MAG: aspartate/glutamate racemase family protein, partial [Desulfobacteraceae bacterium]|nr:aspartate/glutamate racemase family protein [Desulfobacteraceae bacterium]
MKLKNSLMNLSYKKSNSSKKTILVTDSGLGGMSVFARIVNHLVKKSPWQKVSMIYFNAWPEQDKGYNHFENMDQKAKVFNNALNAMENFRPDTILIACNTLSVIYPFTAYSKNTRTKISGIVDHGVQLIHENLDADRDSHVIIFGTPTTIAEKTHQLQLIKMGIDPDRIISQGCTNLAGKIERNPFSSDVSKMIFANVAEAVSKMHNTHNPMGKVYAALCCTHFGY